ncbi:hypothetical protein E4T56_gene14281, partial [Termitomyces sp. T112]
MPRRVYGLRGQAQRVFPRHFESQKFLIRLALGQHQPAMHVNVEWASKLFFQPGPFIDGHASRFQKPPLDLKMQRSGILARGARIDAARLDQPHRPARAGQMPRAGTAQQASPYDQDFMRHGSQDLQLSQRLGNLFARRIADGQQRRAHRTAGQSLGIKCSLENRRAGAETPHQFGRIPFAHQHAVLGTAFARTVEIARPERIVKARLIPAQNAARAHRAIAAMHTQHGQTDLVHRETE